MVKTCINIILFRKWQKLSLDNSSAGIMYTMELRFITGFKVLTHHCELYERVGSMRRLQHWYIFIYKATLGLLPSYLLTYISVNNIGTYNLHSEDLFLQSVPKARTELGKKTLKYA